MPVTVTMEGWQVCFFVLIVDLASGRDIPKNSKYVIRLTDSCPDVGYYFRRDPSPNVISPGRCYLCFCQNNGTAVCWERDSRRCDVEKYHHHRVGRRQSRFRRSPGALSDIFFRDASRDFLNTRLPEECKPTDPSFSDGCPPADWCIGCTICDCDANGRWDCHVLSFCDGKHHQAFEGKKKKVKTRSVGSHRVSRVGKRTVIKNSSSKPRATSRTTTKPPRVKKVNKSAKQSKPHNKTQKKQKNKLVAKKKTSQAPKKQAPRQQTKKPYKKKLPPKRQPQKKKSRKLERKHPTSNVSKNKIIKKNGRARKSINLKRSNMKRGVKLNPNRNDTVKLGKKIVKQVLTSVQKMLNKMNATRVQRSARFTEGKDCGRLKKRYKTINNVITDAVARNKNKHKIPTSINDSYNYRRFKREIVDKSISDTENMSVIAIPDNRTVIPLATAKPQNNSSTHLSTDVTLTTFPTPQQDTYYKYSFKNDANGTRDITFIKITTESNNKPDIFSNFIIPNKPKKYLSSNVVDNNKTTVIPDSNNLTFTKWYIITAKTDDSKKPVKRLLLPKTNVNENNSIVNIKSTDGYLDENLETDLQRKDAVKKYEITKKHWHHILRNYSRRLSSAKTPSFNSKPRIIGTNTILNNLIRKKNRNNMEHKTRPKPKSKVTNLVKNIRKFFHQMFSDKKTRTRKVYGIGIKEDYTLQMLCENIGSCKINRNNKFILKYKLKRLNEETRTILTSIKIIKGLLKLLDLPKCYKIKDHNESRSFKNDVRKLNIILRDNFNIEQINVSLTDTQMTQINYIKMSIQTFVESVKKFSDILNETLAIIKPNTENDIAPRLLSNRSHNPVPYYKIKKMLYKYNVIQNTFIKNMYEFINRVEKNSTTTERIQTQVSDLRKNTTQSDDEIVEKYSRNIIENLRRLKNIAEVLSTTRQKRNIRAMNDNALEFLLALMEYMIKPNRPLDNIRANDGIDFLLDAIKNAPDIKLIKNNLNYVPNTSSVIKSTHADFNDQLIEESVPESKQISKEDKQINIDDNLLRNKKVWQAEQTTEVAYDETTKVYYRVFNVRSPIVYNENISETTTENRNITKKRSSEDKEKTGLDKFESSNEDSNKYEVYTGDIDDDTSVYGAGSVAASNSTDSNKENAEVPNTLTLPPIEIITMTPIVERKDSSSKSQESKSDGKIAKFDWIEAQFDTEIKEFNNVTESDPIKTHETTQLTPTATPSNKMYKAADNKSDITAEIEGIVESEKKSLAKLTSNDIMHKKQMEFLNSLDYGTEKSETEEKDSKDDARSDDGSPSYFI